MQSSGKHIEDLRAGDSCQGIFLLLKTGCWTLEETIAVQKEGNDP